MKYTRYNIKKKRNLTGVIIVVIITVFALAGGTLLAKIIFKGQPSDNKPAQTVQNKNSSPQKNDNGTIKSNESNASGEKFTVSFVQCGYFGNKDNADKTKKELEGSKIKTVVINDNSKYRVIAYVGDVKGSDSMLKSLKDKSINAMRMNVEIAKVDDADNQAAEIIKGYIKLLDALNKDDVKSVKTSDFKKWASALKELSDGNNIKAVNEIKKNIKTLPDEIKKEESESIYNQIFKVVNVYKH